MTRTVPAPVDLGIEVLSVVEGSPVDFDLRLEAVMEGVLVTGTAHANLVGECVRCLETIHDELDVDLQELFVYSDKHDDRDPRDEDDDARVLQDCLLYTSPSPRD